MTTCPTTNKPMPNLPPGEPSWQIIRNGDWSAQILLVKAANKKEIGHILCDLMNEKSEWEFPDTGLLVVMNCTKSDSSRVKTMGLLDTSVQCSVIQVRNESGYKTKRIARTAVLCTDDLAESCPGTASQIEWQCGKIPKWTGAWHEGAKWWCLPQRSHGRSRGSCPS